MPITVAPVPPPVRQSGTPVAFRKTVEGVAPRAPVRVGARRSLPKETRGPPGVPRRRVVDPPNTRAAIKHRRPGAILRAPCPARGVARRGTVAWPPPRRTARVTVGCRRGA